MKILTSKKENKKRLSLKNLQITLKERQKTWLGNIGRGNEEKNENMEKEIGKLEKEIEKNENTKVKKNNYLENQNIIDEIRIKRMQGRIDYQDED